MKLTPEDFDAWRASPMTRLVLDRYIGADMADTRERHDALSWESNLSEEQHTALRERYDTLEWVQQMSFEELSEWLKQQST